MTHSLAFMTQPLVLATHSCVFMTLEVSVYPLVPLSYLPAPHGYTKPHGAPQLPLVIQTSHPDFYSPINSLFSVLKASFSTTLFLWPPRAEKEVVLEHQKYSSEGRHQKNNPIGPYLTKIASLQQLRAKSLHPRGALRVKSHPYPLSPPLTVSSPSFL